MAFRCVRCNNLVDGDTAVCPACDAGASPFVGSVPSSLGAGREERATVAVASNSPVCRACSVNPPEPYYTSPLCTDCRDQLSRRPVPAGIRIVAVAITIVVAVAFARFPAAIKSGIELERAKRAEAAGKFQVAEQNYAMLCKAYPDSTTLTAHLGLAAYHAGDMDTAGQAFQSLSGKSASSDDDLNQQVNAAIDDMNKAAPDTSGATGNSTN